MSTPFEKAIWNLRSYIPYDNKEMQEKYEKMIEEIKHINKSNINMYIKVGNIEETQIYIGDMQAFDDYDILTGIYRNDDGEEFSTEKEYDEYLETQKEEEFKKWKIKCSYIVNDISYENKEKAEKVLSEDDEIEEIFTVYNEDILEEEFDNLDEAKEYIEEQKEEWIENQPEFEDLEKKCDEIYWNYAWKYYDDDIDVELAQQLGLVVIDVREGNNVDGGTYLTLNGCGMDLSPKLIAYQALQFGYIDSQYVSKLRTKNDREYFKYVVGENNYKQVIEKLGLSELLKDEEI